MVELLLDCTLADRSARSVSDLDARVPAVLRLVGFFWAGILLLGD